MFTGRQTRSDPGLVREVSPVSSHTSRLTLLFLAQASSSAGTSTLSGYTTTNIGTSARGVGLASSGSVSVVSGTVSDSGASSGNVVLSTGWHKATLALG